jgi:hypothetical protein
MQTWVLIITVMVNAHVVGVTSVPGYDSLDSCARAGRSAKNQLSFEGRQVDFVCIDGPKK